ncbi:murein transglycosylase domain-containing protein [Sulfurospirillum arcachonense]|uniref:murein transglycosylase domain-containing protein n=1 Tax=Sulfurospirillum arcachonense TaxID=57666 RepID=UPI00046AF84D|nr:murein transglycosylase domain-containing protein [Sulfurospirillum arcachonense]
MKSSLFLFICSIVFLGCSTSDYQSLARAAVSKNPNAILKSYATTKGVQYASNPKSLEKDLKSIDKNIGELFAVLTGEVSKKWGKKNVKTPSKKEYVKYMQNYKSRALVDFDKGIIRVETLDSKKSLKTAIVTTLLLPEDPRSADLFSSNSVKLGSTPYLLGEVKDDQNKNIRYSWRANRYADILLKTKYKTQNIQKDAKNTKVHYVEFPMVKDHASVRVAKFKPYVQKYAKKFSVSENLIYAIIKTESNFNQFAVSGAGAYGLMQIVPKSAGRDAYKFVKGKTWTPSKSYLFEAKNNIELGSAYINIIDKKYLAGINNPISKEYCVISAYNTGSGNVLKTFHKDRNSAKKAINASKPNSVYSKLRTSLPYAETRRYLKKVVDYKKDFVNL